jgi:PST family polysaccharide transporter
MSIVTGERTISALGGLLVAMLSARFLGPEAFGQLSLALSIVALLAMLSMLGLDTLLLQRLVEAEDSARRLAVLRAGFLVRSASGVVSFGFASILAFVLGGHAGAVLVLVATPLVFNGFGVAEALLLAGRRVLVLSAVRLVSAVVHLTACAVLVGLVVPLPWFAVYLLAGAFVLALAYGLVLAMEGVQTRGPVDRDLCLDLIRLGWPVVLSYLFVSIHVQVDRVMISALLGDSQTGIYTAAARPVEGLFGLPLIALGVLIPGIIDSKRAGIADYARRWQGIYDGMAMAGLVMAIPLMLFSVELMHLLYGDAYVSGSSVMAVTACSGILMFLGAASGKWMILEGLTQQYFVRTIFGLLLNIAGNFLLLPVMGIVGAALSTLIAQIGVVLVADMAHPQTRPALKQKLKALMFPLRFTFDQLRRYRPQ